MKLILLTFLYSFSSITYSTEVDLNNVVLSANDNRTYANIRESKSRYINKENISIVLETYNDSYKLGIIRSIMDDSKINKCASKLLLNLSQSLHTDQDNDLENAILALRLDNAIDDVTVSILMRSLKAKVSLSLPIKSEGLNSDDESAAQKIYASKILDFRKGNTCPEDSYISLYASVSSHSNLFARQFKSLNKLALKNKIISNDEYSKIEYFRIRKIHEWPVTLNDYSNNLRDLKLAFPLRVKEETVFVTETKFGQKKSLREALHERFNSAQIILISNVMRNLRKRLDAESVTISINYKNEESEIINLTPMEQFRVIIKILRKEMAILNNSNLLNGQRVSYSDVIAASYETGFINSVEIEQLASLEELWNPKKTKREKTMFWVKAFGEVSSILLPPPYGFISIMVIMIVDQQISDPKADPNADYNII